MLFSLSQTAKNISVIIPALNEELSIGKVIVDLPKKLIKEIIVVDNGSTDRTAEIATACGARVIRQPLRGYGRACLSGIKCLSQDIDIVVFIDADYSDYPQELTRIIEPIVRQGYDIVIGSRLLNPENKMVIPRINRIGNKLASWMMKNLFNLSYSDLGPFRAIRRHSLDALHMSDLNFGWTIEMQIKAGLKGLRIKEVPVGYRKRIGTPKITGTFWGSVKAFCKISFTIIKYKFLMIAKRHCI